MADVPSSPIVKELRISLVWAQALPPEAADTWYERWWPADHIEYIRRVSEGTDREFSLPWSGEGDASSHFWNYYLETGPKGLPGIKAREAWKHLVPLRLAKPVMRIKKLQEASGQGRMAMEGYVYPYGAGVVATIYLDLAREKSLPAAVTFAIQAFRGFWKPDGARPDTLQNLASVAMERLRKIILQKDDYRWDRLSNPYTVTTFIDVEGAAASPVEDGGMIHHALEGLCLWGSPDDWAKLRPEPLLGNSFPLNSDEFHVRDRMGSSVYGVGRGRVVWFPELFDRALAAKKHPQEKHRKYWLGRYHRNLSMASLQAGGLISLLDAVKPYMLAGTLPQGPLSQICQYAAGACGRMYGSNSKNRNSYGTWGTIQQIEEKLESFNLARKYFWPQRSAAPGKRTRTPIQNR